MDYGLRDRVVLITGGARGIGFAAAQMFAAEGARLALVDIDRAAAEAFCGAAGAGRRWAARYPPSRRWSVTVAACSGRDGVTRS